MKIHEFGPVTGERILLFHPAAARWEYFEFLVPLLAEDKHILIPEIPGYEEEEQERTDFLSVEATVTELVEELRLRGIQEVDLAYGCSMGGSLILRLLAEENFRVQSALIDGGITPYPWPMAVNYLIAIKDFLLLATAKHLSPKLIARAFTSDDFSEEDIHYISRVLKSMSSKTIWNIFFSCNNYTLPEEVAYVPRYIEYCYAKTEARARKLDLQFVKARFPSTEVTVYDDAGHGGLAIFKPEMLAEKIRHALSQGGPPSTVSYRAQL